MEPLPSSRPSENELELICWLIDRIDNLRSSAANRAAIVISADAIFLTGVTFLLDKFLSSTGQYGSLERMIFLAGSFTTILLLASSIVYATNAIAFVWQTSKQALKSQALPDFLFFRPRDTEKVLPVFETFVERYLSSSTEEMISYGLGELYIATRVHNKRYGSFRRSIRLLLIAVLAFLVCIAVFVFRYF